MSRANSPNLIVLPAKILSQYKSPNQWAAVSITSPHYDWVNVNSTNRMGLLQLKFDDITQKRHSWEVEFEEGHAQLIWEFVEFFWGKVDEIIFSCQKGWSRSPACAAAVCKVKFGNDERFWTDYSPNKLVYEKMVGEASNIGGTT